MNSDFLEIDTLQNKLSLKNYNEVLDLWFYYGLSMYAKHPDRKDIRKIYEVLDPISKSVRINFGLNDQETVYAKKYEQARYNCLNVSDPSEDLKWKYELAKNLLDDIGIGGNELSYDVQPHRFHNEFKQLHWSDRYILKNLENKTHTSLEKSKIIFKSTDLEKSQKLALHLYQFNDKNSLITVNRQEYYLSPLNYKIIKAIYDLTYSDKSIVVRRADIESKIEIQFSTKGLRDIFTSSINSPEYQIWTNFIEIVDVNNDKKIVKSSTSKASAYRIKLQKPTSYHVDRLSFKDWLNRSK